MTTIIKRFTLYVVGMFLISLSVSFSILANLGVSPGSSLSYAFSLTTGLSVGVTTIFLNLLYILIQMLVTKKFDWKDILMQMIIGLSFGTFIDANLLLVRTFLPTPDTVLLQVIYLATGLLLIGVGLFLNVSANYTLMPYDQMTRVISRELNMPFGKIKVRGDMVVLIIAGLICLFFLRSFGSIGVGTVISAISIGKIMGWFNGRFHVAVEQWIATPQPVQQAIDLEE